MGIHFKVCTENVVMTKRTNNHIFLIIIVAPAKRRDT